MVMFNYLKSFYYISAPHAQEKMTAVTEKASPISHSDTTVFVYVLLQLYFKGRHHCVG